MGKVLSMLLVLMCHRAGGRCWIRLTRAYSLLPCSYGEGWPLGGVEPGPMPCKEEKSLCGLSRQ